MLRLLTKIVRKNVRHNPTGYRLFSSLPDHTIVPMPALSPTMESGSIANWLLKEGDAFEVGQAICEVETDKATVTYDATDDGYLAKILVGSGEIEVGTPLMVTVEDSIDVSAFSDYTIDQNTSPSTQLSNITTDEAVESRTVPHATLLTGNDTARLLASPLARRLARDADVSLHHVSSVRVPSGPKNRLLGEDVLQAVKAGAVSPVIPSDVSSVEIAQPSLTSSGTGSGIYTSLEHRATSSSISSLIGGLSTKSKREIPHYYLSVEISVRNILSLQESLADKNISIQDILVKAAAKAIEKVPAVNAAWMDSFVRQYDQVDINIIIGEGSSLHAPLLRNVGCKGLSAISQDVNNAYDSLQKQDADISSFDCGTFTIQNLGMYDVHSAAAIVIPPQACALTLGAVSDTIIPQIAIEGEKWQVAPVMVCTLSCDHRVIDGAVGASWLKAFKGYAENPMTLLL